jgi:DNA-binding MarR family transcriptional regulator
MPILTQEMQPNVTSILRKLSPPLNRLRLSAANRTAIGGEKEPPMPQPPTPDGRVRECFVSAARKASRRLTQFYDDALAPSGLRSTQYAILNELEQSPRPPTLAELASALVSDRSAVGHNLRPLIRDGFIALEPGPNDRRERRIVLTPRGQSKHGEARPLWQTAQNEFLAVHGRERCESLRAALLEIAYDERLGRSGRGVAP